MSDLKAAQEMMAAAVAARQNADPAVTSATQLLKALDRSSKNVRTFGQQNSVAQKFFSQFYSELNAYLTQFDLLVFVVQREGLYIKEQFVYSSQSDNVGENFAFKLYSDGIRELTFHTGITEEDVLFFFDALWGISNNTGTEDDDIVTRLWAKNLPTITIVTADEVMKISEIDDVLAPQGAAPLEASLREIIAESRAQEAKKTQEAQSSRPRLVAGITGYEVSEIERAALLQDILAESARDNAAYILDMLGAILSSETSPALLSKLLDIYEAIVKSLFQEGHWSLAEQVMGLLIDAEAIRPDFTLELKEHVSGIIERLGSPEVMNLIGRYLNESGSPTTEGLLSVFLMLRPSAVPALCALLGTIEHSDHQRELCTALTELGRNTPDVLTRHLTDRRPIFVRNLLGILTQWNHSHTADAVEKIIRYPDPLIRREVVRTLAILRPNGNGTKIVPLMNDQDEAVRLAVLNVLLTGNYTAPFSTWEPIVTAETFGDRPPAERRNIFHAMRATAADEAVPYWTELLTERGWINRKRREDLALMAVDALRKLGTDAAQAAIQTGLQKGTAAVKESCANALAQLSKQRLKI